MRPLRLEVSGFTAFREQTVVDFTECDFFAFCGPTGAGKSSLIDAICFALYGAIPRIGDKQVAPIISQGMLEATVRLDFAIEGIEYSALRVVRRTKTGASTPEARLQRGDEVLAGSAEAVTSEVEKLLGLSFKHFTKCVVLPQGQFAEFLHAKPAERQDLLVQLLDLAIYEQMGRQSNQIASEAQRHAAWLHRRLEEDFSFATAEAKDEHNARLAKIKAFARTVEDSVPQAEEFKRIAKDAVTEYRSSADRIERLKTVRVPATLSENGERIAAARATCAVRIATLGDCEKETLEAESRVAALPKRSDVEIAIQAHAEHEHIRGQLAQVEEMIARLCESEADAAKESEAAEERYKTALDRLEAIKLEHRAHEMAATLVPNEPCPVCRQPVAVLPGLDPVEDVQLAERTANASKVAALAAGNARIEVEKKRAASDSKRTDLLNRLDALASRIKGSSAATLQATLQALDEADQCLQQARIAERAAKAGVAEATKALETEEAREKQARRSFEESRHTVSDMFPPAPEGEDLQSDWNALHAWAEERMIAEQTTLASARLTEEEANNERQSLHARLLEGCQTLGINPAPKISQAVSAALAEQQSRCDRIEEALIEVKSLIDERQQFELEHEVAAKLGRHLSSSGFEKWLLDEAIVALLEEASGILLQLSADAYSLELDDKSNFVVLDHRNASERRLVKTLSGGETFLASLSLALALSQRISQLASNGARLEAIFLDEGFGSLDPETLDVVASAIEGLASERMVGLVTHVASIAERVPVRFDVHKQADTSRVVRSEN